MSRRVQTATTPIALLVLVVYFAAVIRPPFARAQEVDPAHELTELPADYAEGLHDEAALQELSDYFTQQGTPAAETQESLPELSEEDADRVLAALPKGGGAISAQAASTPSGAATQLGMGESFSTQLSTGGAAYSVPLSLPSARGLVQPRLELTYNSAGGFGIAGVGWNIGASAISRQGDRGLPQYDDRKQWYPEQDRFTFGGSELVPICTVGSGLSCAGAQPDEQMPAWASGWQYMRTRIESGFLRFFWSPDHRTWRVQGHDGSNIELGVPLDGTGYEGGLEGNPDRSEEIYRWHMTRQYDSQGDVNGLSNPAPVNVIYYRYVADGNSKYLSDIYDTSPAEDATTTDLSTFAHHTRLVYEGRTDPMVSYRAGYRGEYGLRLSRVDIASKPFSGSIGDQRTLVRRYHLQYEANSHRSLLTSVQMEGRCDSPVEEGANETLPSSNCPRMPAAKFQYERIESSAQPLYDAYGYAFDPFVETVEELQNSPPHSLDEALTALVDANADGLPDVLVTAPGLFDGDFGLFPNGLDSSGFTGFSRQCTMSVEPAADVLDAGGLMLNNPNVTPMDLDADGLLDLVHMPAKQRYSVFRTKDPFTQDCPDWEGREVLTADQQDVKIDFTRDAKDTRVMDVNGDGLVDIVYSSPTEIQTFYALGRYPDGADRFGQANWTGAQSADISTEPVRRCAPWSATPARFSDEDIRVGDMNGDGLPDVVRVRAGQVLYWPGRGNGFWGTGDRDDCLAGNFAVERHIQMDHAPYFGTTLPGALQLNDINGDGLDDIVEFRNQGVDIYLNDNGTGFTERHIIADTPFLPSDSNYARLTDINGSGTPDILWGRAYEYKYIDLTGGKTPHLLTRIDNGLGKTMELEYQSSAQHMLQAQMDGEPWSMTAPVVMPVLVRTVVRDNLNKVGRPEGVHETFYKYRDPVYEGRQREFRGFREAVVTAPGDAYSGTVHQRTVHHLGECPTDYVGTSADVCGPTERWRDNWREALKGVPILNETYDDRGVYLSTTHPTLELRQLYTGLDGRRVVAAMPVTNHAFAYDAADHGSHELGGFDGATSTRVLDDVILNLDGITGTEQRSVTLRAEAGRVKVESRTTYDNFGNPLKSEQHGCVEGCPSGQVDEVLTAESTFERPADDGSGWLYREKSSFIAGNQHTEVRNQMSHEYDSRGQLLRSFAALSGTLPLDRFHASGQTIAPSPPEQSGGQGQTVQIRVIDNTYDQFGHIVAAQGANHSCSEGDVDPLYAHLPVEARVFAGELNPLTGCGDRAYVHHVSYDRGLEAVVDSHALAPSGGGTTAVNPAHFVYDGFGRPTEIFGGHPDDPTSLAAYPSTKVEYRLPNDASSQPYSVVVVQTMNGPDVDTPEYVTSYAFVDGFDRGIVTLSPADPDHCDGGDWVASGDGVYSRKGLLVHECRPEFYSGDPLSFPLAGPRINECTTTEYDAFGRAISTYALDGAITSHVEHHALSQDAKDANDLVDDTYVTSIADGHGRGIQQTVRFRDGIQMREKHTFNDFLPTGEVERVTLSMTGQTDVVRWMRYDSFGRMVLNVEPNTSTNFTTDINADPSNFKAIRYAYNDAGQIVGYSDARGCGANYHYDAGGRMVAIDRSPCASYHPAYTSPNLTTGTGTEGFYRYDYADTESGVPVSSDPLNLWGRLASVSGPASKGVYSYDGLGRTVATAAKVVKPGTPSSSLSTRYAPRWYTADVDYDAANRPTRTSTGVPVAELKGADGTSNVYYHYSKRGGAYRIDSSYGSLYECVSQAADGRPLDERLGDAAQTTRHYTYDARLAVQNVITDRGAVPLWSNSTYQWTFPTGGDASQQLEIEHYDYVRDYESGPGVGNIVSIYDNRVGGDWPAGKQPVDRHFQYDDLYRLKHVTYDYGNPIGDVWESPYARENTDAANGQAVPERPQPIPQVSFLTRIKTQDYQYDWLGNLVRSDDDVEAFWDRSTGSRAHGTATAGPHQLKSANNSLLADGSLNWSIDKGTLQMAYDDAGNVTDIIVSRDGPCIPSGASCWQRFRYEWDELGQLSRARRWDLALFPAERLFNATLGSPLPSRTANADMRYSYDSSGSRVLKTAVDRNGAQRHTLYISGAVEVRSATYSTFSGEYTLNPERVSLRLPAGFATARVMYTSQYLPDDTMSGFGGFTSIDRHQHMFLELSDHLGSSSAIIDHETGELVEFSTYEAYGTTESDYRPGRWDNFREQYKFSGKEEDIEVGLVYFGARFYSPYLNVWMSPDPVTIHDLGSDTNPYSYVAGRPVMAVDPDGRAIFTLTGLAVAAVIGAVVAAATSVVVQAAANDWNFKQIDWGIKGVLGQALVGAVTSAVSFGVGSIVSSAAGATGAAAIAVNSATGAGLGAANYGIGSAITGSQVTAAGFASAVAGGAAGGAVGGTGCGFGTSLAAGGTGATASFVSGAAITGDWSAKGFALSVGSAVAGAAAGFGLGMLCFVRGTKVTRADGSQEAIEDVELGERVLPSSDACEALDVSDWLRYDFVVPRNNEGQADLVVVSLLRPSGWIPGLAKGEMLWLDLDELGVYGWAMLVAVTPHESVGTGSGCPVIGTFTGLSDSVISLFLEGSAVPLELTAGHRLFSAAREDWVEAAKLEVGEELRTVDGKAHVQHIVRSPRGAERVFNLEIADQHAYHVGTMGVLAHNPDGTCGRKPTNGYEHVKEDNPNAPATRTREFALKALGAALDVSDAIDTMGASTCGEGMSCAGVERLVLGKAAKTALRRYVRAELRKIAVARAASSGGFRAAGKAALRKLGLGDVKLAGRSYNSGRKQLESAGFELSRTTDTGRKVFTNSKTGAQVAYDSGEALAPGQKPHWHIQDSAGNRYSRTGRIVDSSSGAGHIPAF